MEITSVVVHVMLQDSFSENDVQVELKVLAHTLVVCPQRC